MATLAYSQAAATQSNCPNSWKITLAGSVLGYASGGATDGKYNYSVGLRWSANGGEAVVVGDVFKTTMDAQGNTNFSSGILFLRPKDENINVVIVGNAQQTGGPNWNYGPAVSVQGHASFLPSLANAALGYTSAASSVNNLDSPLIVGGDYDPSTNRSIGVLWALVNNQWIEKNLGLWNASTHSFNEVVGSCWGINDRCEIIGDFSDASGKYLGGLWQNGRVVDLDKRIGSKDYSGFYPREINKDGAMLAYATRKSDGQSVSVLLLPAELTDSNDAILDNNNDTVITPKVSETDKNPKSIAWIEPHRANGGHDPEMPWPVLRFRGTEQMGLNIRWKLKVKYNRPNGRILDEDTVTIPSTNSNPSDWVTESLTGVVNIWSNNSWINAILTNGFFGGDAELTFQLLKDDNSVLSQEMTLKFYIGGKNPDDLKCKDYITEIATVVQQPMASFAYAIAKHESKDYNGGGSRYNQFWEKGDRFAGVEHHGGEVLWANNPGEAPPKGFGMFQVTGNQSDPTANISRNQLWNWQDNVKSGLDIIASKRGIADRYFGRIQRRSAAHKAAYQADPPPNIPVGSHIFSSADAIQIYCYNGTGSYKGKPAPIDIRYPFDPNKPPGLGATKRWFWNPHNIASGEPYINDIEHELE